MSNYQFRSYREESRKNWGTRCVPPESAMDNESIKLGALLRIADATDLMAKNHATLIEERDRYQRWYESERAEKQRLRRRLSAAKGLLTRFKRTHKPHD